MEAAAGLGIFGLMIGFVAFLIGLGVTWFIIRDATKASHVVERLDGLNRRLDLVTQMLGQVGQLLNERLPRQQ